MINSTKIYIVSPLFERPEAFFDKAAADHYMHLCRLMGKEPQMFACECNTFNFRHFCEMYDYYIVYYYTYDNVIIIEQSDARVDDAIDDLEYVDHGKCFRTCLSSLHPAIQALFLKGDEEPLKKLSLEKLERYEGAQNESNIS